MPPRQHVDPSSRLSELEKDNSYMATAAGGAGMNGIEMPDDDVLFGGAAGTSSASSSSHFQRVHIGRVSTQHDKLLSDSMKTFRKNGEKEYKKEKERRLALLTAAASAARKKVAALAKKKKLDDAASGGGTAVNKTDVTTSSKRRRKFIKLVRSRRRIPRGLFVVSRQLLKAKKEGLATPAAGTTDASCPPATVGGGVSEFSSFAAPLPPMSRALSSWLCGTFPQPTTVTGLPIGPSLSFLSAPSPSALEAAVRVVTASPSIPSAPLLCSICHLPAQYKCQRCRAARFCSIECSDLHEDMRCNKFVA